MVLRIACIFPFTGDRQGEITQGLDDFFKRFNVETEHAPGVLKMVAKLDTVNEQAGILLRLVSDLTAANGGKKFDPPIRIEQELAFDPVEV